MNCPKCKQPVEQCGELAFEDQVQKVFQCENETCAVPFVLGGKSFPAAFTFSIDQSGRYFNPETMERIELN